MEQHEPQSPEWKEGQKEAKETNIIGQHSHEAGGDIINTSEEEAQRFRKMAPTMPIPKHHAE